MEKLCLLVQVDALAVEPVLAAVALDHEGVAVVWLLAEAVQLLLLLVFLGTQRTRISGVLHGAAANWDAKKRVAMQSDCLRSTTALRR